jgi:hypothetical protein
MKEILLVVETQSSVGKTWVAAKSNEERGSLSSVGTEDEDAVEMGMETSCLNTLRFAE